MRDPRKMGPARASILLRRARQSIRKDPTLAGALNDPETIRAADLVIETMHSRGVLPTGLNVFRHLDDEGYPEERALILAAIVEKRMLKAARSR